LEDEANNSFRVDGIAKLINEKEPAVAVKASRGVAGGRKAQGRAGARPGRHIDSF